MYKFIRSILFLFSPETIHKFSVKMLKLLRYMPLSRFLLRKYYTEKSQHLKRKVFGITFPNPVGLAAGFDKNAEIYDILPSLGFGFVEVGTVTFNAQEGNVKPRLFRLKKDKAIINRMGFNNCGAEAMKINLMRRKNKNAIIGVNIGKNTDVPNENAAVEYEKTFSVLYNLADYFVVNVSCPNIENLQSLQNKDFLMQLLSRLTDFRQYRDVYKPILVKISPDLAFEQIDEIIEISRLLGIDGIVATNTTTMRNNLTTSQKRIEKIGKGGLSGAPLTKRAIEIVSYINRKTEGVLPVIGVGGIMTEDDAVNMINAGARLVQIYSGFIYEGPGFVKRVNQRILSEICKKI